MAPAIPVAFLLSASMVFAEKQEVLFIGNSFSFVNGGIWTQYKSVAEACVPGLQVSTTFKGAGAETLSQASRDPAILAALNGGGYDILVLQDQSELAEDGNDAVQKVFAPQAQRHGALLSLYQTWATPDADGRNLSQGTAVRKQYYDGLARVAQRSGAKVAVARAGEAFQEVLESVSLDYEHPEFLSLLADDYDHPSLLGLNLVAWVMVLSFNARSFSASGCDPNKVPLVPGQSDEQKSSFARIACELAGICQKRPALPSQPLCGAAADLQGEWVRKRTAPECKDEPRNSSSSVPCTYIEKWVVSGTQVTQISRGIQKQHRLRVGQYGDLCTVKLLPTFAYVRQITESKVLFNDCMVWTRTWRANVAEPDECWCVSAQTWTDNGGNACSSYEPVRRSQSKLSCENIGSVHVTRFRALRAWEACPGCERCSPPPQVTPAESRLLASVDDTAWV